MASGSQLAFLPRLDGRGANAGLQDGDGMQESEINRAIKRYTLASHLPSRPAAVLFFLLFLLILASRARTPPEGW